jgi:hypothetical protein
VIDIWTDRYMRRGNKDIWVDRQRDRQIDKKIGQIDGEKKVRYTDR